MCLLKSDERALLLIMRRDGDPGLTSRAVRFDGDNKLRFTLSNGQEDEYPAGWTVPFGEARRAVEYFGFTGSPAPFVSWYDEATSELLRT